MDCIVVKDFSRFSRDYIELGDYIQQIFPFMGVRFISVNDGYDSAEKEAAPELDIYFKSLLYDLYSKDLSVKVRTSLAVRKEKGQYVSANCPFGYEKDPSDRHLLKVREDEAAIVRRIFAMTLEGYTSFSIARKLNEEGIKTPAAFRAERGKTVRKPKKGGFLWHPAVICRILRNEVYVGDLVYGKTEKEAVGGKNRLKPRSEWKRYDSHHEPVIDRRTFELVQKSRGEARMRSEKRAHPLTGIVVCRGCGHNLQLRGGGKPYFFCPCGCVSTGKLCVRKMDASFLERQVLLEIQGHVWRAVSLGEIGEAQRRADREKLREWKGREKKIRAEAARLETRKLRAYEAYSGGRTDVRDYRRASLAASAAGASLAGELAETVRQKELLEAKSGRGLSRAEVMEYFGISDLTRENVREWIAQIQVDCEGVLEISWNGLHFFDSRGDCCAPRL